jgi:PAS domain S-box-containing protein
MPPFTSPSIDSTACEAEPIRFPGAVQPHGALLVLDPCSGIIEAASESCAWLLGHPAMQLLGRPVGQILGPESQSSLLAQALDDAGPHLTLHVNGSVLTAQAHRNRAGQVLVDIEQGGPNAPDLQVLAHRWRAGIKAVRRLGDVGRVSQAAADLVREISGFDRVMIYRFDAAWNGEVVAESAAAGLEPYLGLHYPASDIPQQARDLFQASKVRQIPDTQYLPSALLAQGDSKAIDLGLSCLRSVSPMHIEYLQNMQVRATLVGSLVVEDRLWGLVSCQHLHQARFVTSSQRDALGWLCEDVAELIQERQTRQRQSLKASLAQRRRRLIERLRQHGMGQLLRDERSAELLEVVGADGFALMFGTVIHTTGHTPEPARIADLCRRRREIAPTSAVYASHALGHDLNAADSDDGVAGALFISVVYKPAIQLIWFRDERSRHIRWGGDPGKAHFTDADGRVSPRRSFAQFLQNVRGQAPPWTEEELDSAVELTAMIEIESLREREAFARTILDSIPEHISVLDGRGVVVAVNAAWSRFACANGAPALAESTIGLNYRDICMAAQDGPEGEMGALAWAGIDAVLRGAQTSFALEYPCDSPHQRRWFRMGVSAMQTPAEGVVVAHEDITASKSAERALAASEAQLKAIFQVMTQGVVLHRQDGSIADANPAAEVLLGLSRDQILGRTSLDPRWRAVHEDGSDFAGADHPAMVTLRTGQPLRQVVMGVPSDLAGVRWLSISTQPMPGADPKRPEAVLVTFADITERKQAAARLGEANARLEGLASRQARGLRALAKELTQVEQRERDRLFELLHGGVQPLLVAARLSLSAVSERTPVEQGLLVARDACEQISQVLDVTRRLSQQLTPPLALELGLQPALESLTRWVRKYHALEVTLDAEADAEPLDPQIRLVCFNAVRELLLNVVKHAGVSRATIELRTLNSTTLNVAVRDNGKGITPNRKSHGSGLADMARRLKVLGGSMQTDSRPGHGTQIVLQVPSREIASGE